MAKSRIQGISIVLEGETTGLQKALRDVNKRSVELQQELRDVEKLLRFNPESTEALAQKQKILAQQVENTTEKLDRLRKAQDQVEKQFKSGDIGEKQYRAFRREIEYTEQQLRNLDKKLSSLDVNQVKQAKTQFDKLSQSINAAEENAGGLVNNLAGLAGGVAAGVGIGEVIEKSLDTSSLNTQIDISFNIPKESEESVRNAIKQVESYGTDATEALEGTRRQWALNADATDEANELAVKYASTITRAYSGVDFTEVIQESNELSKILSINNDEALALMDSLISIGFPPDQIDIIAEYGTQLQRIGYTSEEVMALFSAGVATGTQNIDRLIDGVKEGRIRMAEFGSVIDEETASLISQVGISSEQLKSWGQAIATGGEGGKQAMTEVASALQGIDDKTIQNQLGVKLFGTTFEDEGTKIIDTILGVNDNMLDMNGAIDNLNNKSIELDSDPMVRLKEAAADLMIALTPLLEIVADVIGAFANWVSENPKLAATITAIVTVLGILFGIFAALAPIITTITSIAGVLGTTIGAIATPVGWVVAAIVGLISIITALIVNWDWLKAKAIEIFGIVKDFIFQTWENIKSFFSTTIPEIINNIVNWFNDLPEKMGYALGVAIGKVIQWGVDLWNYLRTNVPVWIDNVVNFFSELPSKIWTWLIETINRVAEWGANLWNKGREIASQFISTVVDTLANLPSRMYDIGVNIVQGVWEGITGMWGWLTEKVSSFFSGIVDGVKDTLGIHSPSKVFEELGGYTGEGFALGIEGMSKAVSKAGQDMANAAIPTINIPSAKNLNNNQPQIVYLTTENYLDGKLIGTHTTKQVINNMGRSQKNFRRNKGGLASV